MDADSTAHRLIVINKEAEPGINQPNLAFGPAQLWLLVMLDQVGKRVCALTHTHESLSILYETFGFISTALQLPRTIKSLLSL
jgi:hypothetical protein